MPELPDPFELFGLDPEPVDAPNVPTDAATESAASAVTSSADDAASSAVVAAPVTFAPSAQRVADIDPATEPTPPDPPPGRRFGWKAIALLIVVVLLVTAAGFGIWVKGQIDPGSPGEPVAFSIPKGSTSDDVGRSLAEKGIISSATVFGWYLRVNGGGPFQAGEYDGLRLHSAMGDVVAVLDRGPAPPKTVSFLVREGLWISETRALILETFPTIDPAALTEVMNNTHPPLQPKGSTNLEGFLFPATYEIAQADTGNPQRIIDLMLRAFDQVSTAEGLPDASAKLTGVAGKQTITPYQALIVASLVESEAKVPEDRPKIARVIYNRMARGEQLGIDASVLYAIQQRKGTLTNSDLRTDSPYNTRLRTGLPPTPINSPGQASIHAALNPAPGDWLYYVLTDKDGHHYFTNSASDFQRAVNDAKARGVF